MKHYCKDCGERVYFGDESNCEHGQEYEPHRNTGEKFCFPCALEHKQDFTIFDGESTSDVAL